MDTAFAAELDSIESEKPLLFPGPFATARRLLQMIVNPDQSRGFTPGFSTEPIGAANDAVHAKKYTTFPNPPRSQGIVSNNTAIAATTAMAGKAINRNGATNFQSSTCESSACQNCMMIPEIGRITTIAVSTTKLLIALPMTYIVFDIGVDARISPTRVERSRSIVFFTM